ncbi:LacI family DNA-binding transcriptional regulator [Georgenia halophila]|uniref:LacI family DNA-binding transcriptional regulator n=1 Tax=Georgenia halophila TaxID=620889 RepID=UPI0031EB24BA
MTSRSSNAPTLAVVARAAGVSVPTVSKVLRGRADVAASTRDRVTMALDRLGYPRHTSLIEVAPAGSVLIDVVTHELNTAWAAALLTAVERQARERGFSIVVTALSQRKPSSTPSRQWLNQVAARGSRGVLGLLVSFTEPQVDFLARHGLPCVVVDPYRIPVPGVRSVRLRNVKAERDATTHLLELGHSRIGVVHGKPGALPSQERLDGYVAAMAAAGSPLDPALVRGGGFQVEGGKRAMAELLALPDPPSAVVFASDRMALGGYQAAADLGFRIPDDVSIVGFDDTPEAALAQPPLTSVRQPADTMARAGLNLLEGTVTAQEIRCDAALVYRSSTAILTSTH